MPKRSHHRQERTVANPYDITDVAETSEAPRAARPAGDRTEIMRPLLWLVLAVSAVCNVVASALDVNVFVGVGFGLLTLSCGVALVAGHYRNRRR